MFPSLREGLGEGGTPLNNQGNLAKLTLFLGRKPTPSSSLPLSKGEDVRCPG